MVVRVLEDFDTGPGHAVIDLGRPIVAGVRLAFRRLDAEPRDLGAAGWQSGVHWFQAQVVSDGGSWVRVGPEVVNHIAELVPVEIRSAEDGIIGTIAWPSILHSVAEVLPAGFRRHRFAAPERPEGLPLTRESSPQTRPAVEAPATRPAPQTQSPPSPPSRAAPARRDVAPSPVLARAAAVAADPQPNAAAAPAPSPPSPAAPARRDMEPTPVLARAGAAASDPLPEIVAAPASHLSGGPGIPEPEGAPKADAPVPQALPEDAAPETHTRRSRISDEWLIAAAAAVIPFLAVLGFVLMMLSKPSQVQAPAMAPSQFSDAVSRCDELTSATFDPDRPATVPASMAPFPLADRATEEVAIAKCVAAAGLAGDPIQQRRMEQQVGYAMASRAVTLARAGDTYAAQTWMEAARDWWTKAAERGSAVASNELGLLYDGWFNSKANNYSFVTKDTRAAFVYFLASAEGGYAVGLRNAGIRLIEDGGSKNLEKGLKYIKQSADLGYTQPLLDLGELYYFGRHDVQKREDQGLNYYRRACARSEWMTETRNHLEKMFRNNRRSARSVLPECYERGP